MKARAQSLLTGKLGSLVRSKPPLPPSANVAKPPLPPAAMAAKPSAGPSSKSPQRVPLSPTATLGGRLRSPEERKGGPPVIKPYLVKRGEEHKASEPAKSEWKRRSMCGVECVVSGREGVVCSQSLNLLFITY